MNLILASASSARRAILQNAGLAFDVVPAGIDERAAEKPLLDAGAPPEDLAALLALVKAVAVSESHPGAMVIGADQVLEFDGARMTKPEDMEVARRQLLKLSGKTHALHAAIACAQDGAVLWQHVETAELTMRKLEPAEIGRYLADVGPDALQSVGAYQIEGKGIRLFEKIRGDYFAVLGLPLLPLLAFLRSATLVE